MVVEHDRVDVGGARTGHGPQALRRRRHPPPSIDGEPIVRVMVRRPEALHGGLHVGRPSPEIARTLGRREHDGRAAVGLDAAVEEPQGLRHPARGVMVLEGHGLAHERVRVDDGMTADGACHLAEMIVAGPVVEHVAPRDERHLVCRRHDAERHLPLIHAVDARCDLLPGAAALHHPLPFARLPAPVARAEGQDGRGVATRDRSRGAGDDRAVRPSPVAVRREEAHVAQPEHRHHVGHRVRLDVVQAEPVDVLRREPGVVEGRGDRAARDLRLGDAEMLRKPRLADADDGGAGGHRRLA